MSEEKLDHYDAMIAEALENAKRYKNSQFGKDEARRAADLKWEKEAIEKGLPIASAE